MVVAVGRALQGAAMSVLDDPALAVDQMTEGLDAYAATGTKFQRPFLLTLLADALLRAEQFSAGLKAVDDALGLMEASGECNFLSEAYRLQGDLRQAQGDTSVAYASYQQALNVAQRQEARLLELRAATSLVVLTRGRDQRTSRDRLASIYAWFTDGFNTLDLRNARDALDKSQAVSEVTAPPTARRD
jgi:predicted ATPase